MCRLPRSLLMQLFQTSDEVTSDRATNAAVIHLNDVLLHSKDSML